MNINSIKISTATLMLTIFGGISVVVTSCKSDPNSPGFEYMPDMYRSPSYETYLNNDAFGGKDSMSARLPVPGTVAQNNAGFDPSMIPYEMDASNESYAQSDNVKNPVEYSELVGAEGKDLYMKMCQHCHGETGNGDGLVVTNGGFPPPPSYSTGNSSRGGKMKDLSAGKIYHTITYGLNMMGSHASQISPEDRWKIVHYIYDLQGNKRGVMEPDSTTSAQ